jgi:hypothetical protein
MGRAMNDKQTDIAVEAWALSHGLVLFRDGPTRFCHTSSEQGECFQLVMHPPDAGSTMIEVFSIETIEDEELHKAWTSPVGDISTALDEALACINGWKRGVGRSD